MSLAEAPINAEWKIAAAGGCERGCRYAAAGVSVGRHAVVLARYPVKDPRFVEVELEGTRLVTLPIDVATGFIVEPVARTQ